MKARIPAFLGSTLASISLFAGLSLSTTVQATWSVVVFDTETQEVAVGGATCLSREQVPGIDLIDELAVVVVGAGGGAAQSFLDASGQRRSIISNGIRGGLTATQIRNQLIQLSGTSGHQHGIAGAGPTQATQTGSGNGRHASGVAGANGNLHYAIQGNVITGPELIQATEQALINDGGDLPQRLMAAMETARDFGGDGRCSCSGPSPDSCGSPPPSFSKSAHVGFMIVSRFGDLDSSSCGGGGCANGDYFMQLNVANQTASAPDPVDQLRNQFDQFRTSLNNRPDAIQSDIAINPVSGGFDLILDVKDWRGIAVNSGILNVSAVHAPNSAGNSAINAVIDNGNGRFTIQLSSPAQRIGDDRFVVTIDDGLREVVIPPERTFIAGNSSPSCPAGSIDFNAFATTSFSNQDNTSSGSVAVQDAGTIFALTGNRWRASTQSFNITPNTVLEFEFAGGPQGEIHGIGFDEDDTISQNRIFRFWGTQSWGTSFNPQYSGTGSFQSYRIPVGQSYTGDSMRLVFVNDKDATPQDAVGRFRCVRVIEESTGGGGQCSLEQNFDSNANGWTNAGSASCSTGSFVRATPTLQSNSGVTTQVGGDNTTGSGAAMFTAVNTSAGSDDVDAGTCVLESPSITINEASTLNMAYFHGQRDANDDNGDFFALEVSTNDGASYTPVVSLGDVLNNAVWTDAPATSIAAGSTVKIRLRVADGAATGDLIEAGLDDVSICPN